MQLVSILCTDPRHPVNESLESWARSQAEQSLASVKIARDAQELDGGDFLFLVSCHQIIRKPVRDLFRHTLVLHASALPNGRGMSPHIWQILEGAKSITLTMLNAEDELDSGDIWRQRVIYFDGTELFDEINDIIFAAEIELMSWAVTHCDESEPRPQSGQSSYYRKRSPVDSQIDPQRPLAESFELLRIADPDRYPAFFDFRGQRYRIRIEKV